MTEAEPPRPQPILPQPTCDAKGCTSTDTVTVDGINGRRCAEHPPEFSPEVAVELMRRGLPGAAGAYIRGVA